MKITSGEYEVIFSGTVIGIINESIEFQFSENHASIKIIIDFKSDKKRDGSFIDIDVPADKTLKLTLVNLNAQLGSGNTQILDIGYLGTRRLFLNYRVYSVTELSNTLHYSFY